MKLLRSLWGAALALTLGCCLLLAPRPARAQGDVTPELSRDWTIRLGLYIFSSEAARDKAGAVGISGLVERTVYRGDTYDVNVGIGYNGFDTVYSVPLMVYLVGHRDNLRYGGGVGYSFSKRVDGRGSNALSFSLLVGYDLTHGKHPINADLRYYFIGGSSSELDGYSLTLGIKF